MNCFPVNAIILAAGESQRMGKPKMLLPFNVRYTFLEQCVIAFETLGCQNIGIVVNAEGAKLLQQLGLQFPPQTIIVTNPHPEKGRFSSIKIGIQALNSSNQVFIHNVDSPFVRQETLQRLRNTFEADFSHPVYRQKGGHPILLGEKLVRIIALKSSISTDFKQFLNSYHKQTVEVDDPAVLANINSPDDFKFWFGRTL